MFYMDDGGFMSTTEENEPGKELYFIGIIDILTPFNARKRTEAVFRRLFQDKMGVSAVKPSFYGERFFNFMRTTTKESSLGEAAPFPPLPILQSNLVATDQPLSLQQAFRNNGVRRTKESGLSRQVEPILEYDNKVL